MKYFHTMVGKSLWPWELWVLLQAAPTPTPQISLGLPLSQQLGLKTWPDSVLQTRAFQQAGSWINSDYHLSIQVASHRAKPPPFQVHYTPLTVWTCFTLNVWLISSFSSHVNSCFHRKTSTGYLLPSICPAALPLHKVLSLILVYGFPIMYCYLSSAGLLVSLFIIGLIYQA